MLIRKALPSLFVCFAMAAFAAPPPDSSGSQNATGTWKINTAKTDWGDMGSAPSDMVWKIKEDGDILDVVVTYTRGDGVEATEKYRFDKSGKETVNQNDGMDIRTVMREVDGALREESSAKLPDGGTMTRSSVTKVSEDGKTLTQTVKIKVPDGVIDRVIVMEKQ